MIKEAQEIIKAVMASRHWAEEGQAWGFLIDEELYGRMEEFLMSEEREPD